MCIRDSVLRAARGNESAPGVAQYEIGARRPARVWHADVGFVPCAGGLRPRRRARAPLRPGVWPWARSPWTPGAQLGAAERIWRA
eukprot:7152169-Lingulodinium_polyedra.AAC.1